MAVTVVVKMFTFWAVQLYRLSKLHLLVQLEFLSFWARLHTFQLLAGVWSFSNLSERQLYIRHT